MRILGTASLAVAAAVSGLMISGCSQQNEAEETRAAADPSAECADHLSTGADLGIDPVPAELQDSYGAIFCKYIEISAPNGKPIRIFAQRDISNEQMLYSKGVLEFYLEPVPGSEYGADKTAIANAMGDNGATLLMLKGHDGEFKIFEDDVWREIDGQPLYEDEIAAPGSDWYIDNVFDGHRDATFEEILRLVHDNGIGIDVDHMPPGAAPEYQAQIRQAQINALDTEGLWAQDERVADWIEELREEGSLTQEYLASVVDSYYGLWGAFDERPGGMWGFYVAKTREEVAEKDPLGYALMEAFLNPYLTFEARIDPRFEGMFSLAFDEALPYTHKSQYLVDATLTGVLDSGLMGNEQDNTLQGNQGNNPFDGGEGEDTVVFAGPALEYEWRWEGDDLIVTDSVAGRDGQDRLVGIEWLQFEDGRHSTADNAR